MTDLSGLGTQWRLGPDATNTTQQGY